MDSSIEVDQKCHQFKLVDCKTVEHEISILKWNPKMDLLATVYSNGFLSITRLLLWKKVWSRDPNGAINSICWRPDGRVLAIAIYDSKTKENYCALHDVENGKTISSIETKQHITSISWFKYDESITNENGDVHEYLQQFNYEMQDSAKSFCHQLSQEQSNLNILCISTTEGKIFLYALGLYLVGELTLPEWQPTQKIVDVHLSSCFEYATVITQVDQLRNNVSVSLRTMRLEILASRHQEILNVARLHSKILIELEYLDDTMAAIVTCWEDVLAGLDSKLCSYSSRRNKLATSRYGGYTFLGADELLQLLVVGHLSDNLEKFITDMSEKGLKKLNHAIEQTSMRVQNLVVKHAQKCCYHLHNDLNKLKGMSLWREKYQLIGLDDDFVIKAMRSVGSLMLKLTELQQVIDHSLKSAKSFFGWLISVVLSMNVERGNNTDAPAEAVKTSQQNIQLITDFILENFDYNSKDDDCDESSKIELVESSNNRPTCSNFTLEQIGQYFKDESLTRLKHSFTKRGANFWIDFLKDRPELVDGSARDNDQNSLLLFYPHSPDNSLVQEQNNTKDCILTSFNRVADNLTRHLKQHETYMYLKDFIRNVQMRRVHVETNRKLNLHHTIFLTRNIDCMYLLSCMLDDRNAFRLFKISFVPKRPRSADCDVSTSSISSANTSLKSLHICDLCFFNPSVISLLLVDSTDTFIVQVKISHLFEIKDAVYHNIDDVADALKNIKSLETTCESLTIELDVYGSIETRERIPGTLVKRIRSTIGKDTAVCGSRKVVAFTSFGNKKVSLFEIDSCSVDELADEEGDGNIEKNHWIMDETL